MTIEEAFTAFLINQPGLTALINRRFHFEEVEQATNLPAVVCTKIEDNKIHTLTGQLQLERPVFQFTALAATKKAARDVSDQLKKALADFQGTIGGIEVQKIELQNETSSLVKSSDGTLTIYSEDLEFEFNYLKEVN